MPQTGDDPGYVGDEIFVALREYAKRTQRGRAVGDNKGFAVNLPNRQPFSPDAALYPGPPTGMRFFAGAAPLFAAEVRSEGDYGPAAEEHMAAKRADYFVAGTHTNFPCQRAKASSHSQSFRPMLSTSSKKIGIR
jgi:Uma2 family endonuclease